ncbi:MAG: type II secretion system protein M [Clostridiales bacterium]|jgi:hypothetical protein|nr:type II secretion system protein M [Clostridiales bacterium]
MLKLNPTERQLLLILLFAVAAYLVYNFAYQPLDEKHQALTAQNAEAQQRLQTAKNRLAQRDFIETEYLKLGDEIGGYSGRFFPRSDQEEFVRTINELCVQNDLEASSFSFSRTNDKFDSLVDVPEAKVMIDDAMALIGPGGGADSEDLITDSGTPSASAGDQDKSRTLDERKREVMSDAQYTRFTEGITTTNATVAIAGTYQQIYNLLNTIKTGEKYIIVNAVSLAPGGMNYDGTVYTADPDEASKSNGMVKESARMYSTQINMTLYSVADQSYFMTSARASSGELPAS